MGKSLVSCFFTHGVFTYFHDRCTIDDQLLYTDSIDKSQRIVTLDCCVLYKYSHLFTYLLAYLLIYS